MVTCSLSSAGVSRAGAWASCPRADGGGTLPKQRARCPRYGHQRHCISRASAGRIILRVSAFVSRWWHRHSCLCLPDTARSGCVTSVPAGSRRYEMFLLLSQRKSGNLPVGNPMDSTGAKMDVRQGTLALMVLKTLGCTGTFARLRNRPAHRADQRRSARGESRHVCTPFC